MWYPRAELGLLQVPDVFSGKGPQYRDDAQLGTKTVLTRVGTAELTTSLVFISFYYLPLTVIPQKYSVPFFIELSLFYYLLLSFLFWI